MTPRSGRERLRPARRFASVSGVLPAAAETELLLKLKQVQDNAWLVFNELPPGAARTRALHVFLDAQELKKRLEPLLHEPDHR